MTGLRANTILINLIFGELIKPVVSQLQHPQVRDIHMAGCTNGGKTETVPQSPCFFISERAGDNRVWRDKYENPCEVG